MDIAIVGGGINGICTAWILAENGHRVTLFERNKLMSATSSASTKLLHGGLRYLETYQFRLVREALRERAWWLQNAPHLTHPVELFLPVYRDSPRSTWMFRIGLSLYDRLAGSANIAPHQYFDREAFKSQAPEIDHAGIKGGFRFFDGQMDDHALGLWAAGQARLAGAEFHEHVDVSRVSPDGSLLLDGETRTFDRVINIAGPWAAELLERSGIASSYRLELVRGSHILFDTAIERGYFLQAPRERRIFFVLPYKGKTLVGTTEEPHDLDQPVRCSEEEANYLLSAYNSYFKRRKALDDIEESFAGVRPLIHSSRSHNSLSREYAVEKYDKLVSVFGGKWTTARSLAVSVSRNIF